MAPTSLASRAFFAISATFQIFGTLKADFWSESHIFNDRWPPHAKFHTGQTISMAITLALLGLYLAFRPKSSPSTSNGIALRLDDTFNAMLVLDIYWLTQGMAFFFPGTHWCDPPFCFDAAFAPQIGIEVFGFGLNAAAYLFERQALMGARESLGKVKSR